MKVNRKTIIYLLTSIVLVSCGGSAKLLKKEKVGDC